MKHCDGKYLPWTVEAVKNFEHTASPNPLCIGCEYMETCRVRVCYWLEYGKDMLESDVEIIFGAMNPETAFTPKTIILN